MSEIDPTSPVPQFGTLEPSQASDSCKVCRQPITGLYYRANNSMVCGSCADRVKRELPQDSHAAFVRGLLFGLGGFLAALIAYSLVGILLQGWTIGYLSLGVGWIVGKSMMTGSRGIGGRRYQLVAVLLTYAAVSIAAIPITLATMRHDRAPAARTTQDGGQSTGALTADEKATASPQEDKANHAPPMSFAALLGTLALIGLASPFYGLLDGFGGVLMLIILFVGMQFAWKITAGRAHVAVEGPYQLSNSASA